MSTREIIRTGMKERDMCQVTEFFKPLLMDEEKMKIEKKILLNTLAISVEFTTHEVTILQAYEI